MDYSYLKNIFISSLDRLGISSSYNLIFEKPKNSEHGDLSTNIAMQLAKPLGKNPRQIATEIVDNLVFEKSRISEVSIAGAGFINVRFNSVYFTELLSGELNSGVLTDKFKNGNGKKVNVEYVSVNPTGLLHLGHARNASIGDTIANLYDWLGYDVTREYYFNNAGNQMNNLAKSIYARYMQFLNGDDSFPFPEDGYHGEYIKTIASELHQEKGDSLKNGTNDDLAVCRKFGELWCFEKIKATLARMNINQDVFYNEDSLYSEGKIKALIDYLKENNLAYEKDGALWMEFTKLGLNDDRVIVKSTGEPTYRLPDIAYHKEKFLRGFDLMVDIFGADHIATVPDVMAGVKALGYDNSKVKVIIHQFVTLTENGEQVKMSKRTGKNYTLDDLLDEVGADVVRFFLLMRQVGTHLEFDLGLAREQSDKNPVFYLQYAHARICSVIDNAQQKGISIVDADVDFSLLIHPKETVLIKTLLEFPSSVKLAAEKCEPQILAEYLRNLASDFHIFYHECRIIGVELPLQSARLKLASVVRTVLGNGLKILGVNAPDRM